jgi:hypothetical protein
VSAAWPVAARNGGAAQACDPCDAAAPAVVSVIGDTLGPFIGPIDDPMNQDMTGWTISALLRKPANPAAAINITAEWVNPLTRIVRVSAPPAVTASLTAGVFELVVRVSDGVNRYSLIGGLIEFIA